MKVSDIQIDTVNGSRVELPNTDALALFFTELHRQMYIDRHGNVEVVKDGQVYTVPAFKRGREAATAAKMAWCDRYGCE